MALSWATAGFWSDKQITRLQSKHICFSIKSEREVPALLFAGKQIGFSVAMVINVGVNNSICWCYFPTRRQDRSSHSPNNHIVKSQSSFCLFKLDSPKTCCWVLLSGSDSLPSLWICHCCCLMHDTTEVNWSVEIPSHESHVKPHPDVVLVVETS